MPRRVNFPINPLELDAAMQQRGASIAHKAHKVGSYMQKLQSYLEGVEPRGSDRDDGSVRSVASAASLDSMDGAGRSDGGDGAFDDGAGLDDASMSLDQLARLGV